MTRLLLAFLLSRRCGAGVGTTGARRRVRGGHGLRRAAADDHGELDRARVRPRAAGGDRRRRHVRVRRLVPGVVPAARATKRALRRMPATRSRLQAGDRRTVTIALQPLRAKTAPADEPPLTTPDYVPTPDRWDLEFPVWQRYPPDSSGTSPITRGRKRDPYNKNILKGDYPVIGQDIFFVLTMVAETPLEFRRVPTPSGVSAERAGSDEFFGQPDQTVVRARGAGVLRAVQGRHRVRAAALGAAPDAGVQPELREHRRAQRRRRARRRKGKNRRRGDIALQEAFGELKLADVGSNFDFISVRAGIQPFSSDFRGFLFRDTNLGVRLFGNWGRNRNQWNVAYFDQLEKETNSELNLADAPQPACRRGQLLPAGFPDAGLYDLAELPRQPRSRRGAVFRRERVSRPARRRSA